MVTLLVKNDDDNLEQQEHGLRPAERHILAYAKAHAEISFCWREFSQKYAHGTIRNAFSTLARKKLLHLEVRSCDAYYILHSQNKKNPHGAMTVTHMGGKYNLKQLRIDDYEKYLDSLGWEEVWKVHDVTLCFRLEGFYEKVVSERKYVVNPYSKDIQFLTFDWMKYRTLKVVLHRTGTVTCYLKCSERPVEVNSDGLVDLSGFLGKVQTRLEDYLNALSPAKTVNPVQEISNWIVTQWHFGKDGKREISGQSLNTTYKTWSGALVRIYLKKHGNKFRPRKEILEQPRKRLPEAFSEKEAFREPNFDSRKGDC